MKKIFSKIIIGIQLLASLLIFGSVFLWAPVCNKLLTLSNGNMAHMKCYYTGQASIVLAIILIITAISAYLSKTDHHKVQWAIIVIGIMLIANTFDSIIGIGICKNTDMACNTTAVWLRGSGALAIISGFIDIFLNRNLN